MPSAALLTPIGHITVIAKGAYLSAIHIGRTPPAGSSCDLVEEALAQLGAWFAGDRSRFDLPLAPLRSARGQVLRDAITAIPPGETASYGAVARAALSSPRAIGQACARNPFPIVVPCHRVIGSGGALGYYSAGDGIGTKRWLLAHERRDGLTWAT